MIQLDVAHKKFIDKLQTLGRSSSTLVAYGKDIEQLLEYLSKSGVNTVNEARLEHLEGFMKKLSDEGYTNKSISRKTNSTKTFFKYLLEEGHIEKVVSEDLKHPKVAVKAPRILSRLEYRALRDAARDDVRSSAIVEVLLQTGVTISELAGMKVEHLLLDSKTLYIPKRNAKETRTVPLNDAVISSLRAYLEKGRISQRPSEYVFITKTGNPLLVRNIRSTIDRYFRLAGVEKAKVNDLRHTFLAHHLTQGVSLGFLSKVVGHKRISTTERYLDYVERDENMTEKSELGEL
ncbi:MAG: tyrosine-type recombinase/integrase [Patescibacteria group bacterium]|jgi:site-specific recombinase XerD